MGRHGRTPQLRYIGNASFAQNDDKEVIDDKETVVEPFAKARDADGRGETPVCARSSRVRASCLSQRLRNGSSRL